MLRFLSACSELRRSLSPVPIVSGKFTARCAPDVPQEAGAAGTLLALCRTGPAARQGDDRSVREQRAPNRSMPVYDEILDKPDPEGLMTLPSPGTMWPKPPPTSSLYEYANRFYKLWLGLLSGDFGYDQDQSSVSYNCGRCSLTHEYSRGQALQRLLMIVGCIYGYCAHQLVTAAVLSDSDDLG